MPTDDDEDEEDEEGVEESSVCMLGSDMNAEVEEGVKWMVVLQRKKERKRVKETKK